jgi:hypothetical protein
VIQELYLSALVALTGHQSRWQEIRLHLSVAVLFLTVFAFRCLDTVFCFAVFAQVIFSSVVDNLCLFAVAAGCYQLIAQVFLGCELEGLVGVSNNKGKSRVLHYY